jgi:hypothetical protein
MSEVEIMEQIAVENLRRLNTHTKQAALEARVCKEVLTLCSVRKSQMITESVVDVVETLLMLAQHNGVRPSEIKKALVSRCEAYLGVTDDTLH